MPHRSGNPAAYLDPQAMAAEGMDPQALLALLMGGGAGGGMDPMALQRAQAQALMSGGGGGMAAPPETAEDLERLDAERAQTRADVEKAEVQRTLLNYLTEAEQARQREAAGAGQRFRGSRAGSRMMSLDPSDLVAPGRLGY